MTHEIMHWSAGPVVELRSLGSLGTPLSEGDGESLGIYHVPGRTGWLAKIYKQPLEDARVDGLDHLVALRTSAVETDRQIIETTTSWPTARLVDGQGGSVGCVIPEAPRHFRYTPSGAAERFLEVDLLAKPAEYFARRGLPEPTWKVRRNVCTSLATTAALLERHGLVYSDWSYSNAFWEHANGSAFVIDIDGCRVGSNHNIFQPNWEDPLTPRSAAADSATDRYRLGLLVARCLTGQRDLALVLHTLTGLPDRVLADLLLDMLLADHRVQRPTTSSLHATLAGMPTVRLPIQRRPMPERLPGPVAIATVVKPGRRSVASLPVTTPAQAGTAGSALRSLAIMAAVVLVIITMLICLAAL